jgi:hypothetical protein
MKRLLFVCAALLIANCAMAEIITFRSITKNEHKEAVAQTQQHSFLHKGYDQYIDLSYGYNRVSDFLGLNYIGGYRFNHIFFLGLGTGIDFALFTPIMEPQFVACMPTRANIPIYVNFRTNFTNKAWSPYISVSAGVRISPKTIEVDNVYNTYYYNQSGFLGNIIFGIERQIHKNTSLYFGVGYRLESFFSATYYKYDSYDYSYNTQMIFHRNMVHGFNIHIGLSF